MKKKWIALQERKSFKKHNNSLKKTKDSRLGHYLFKEEVYLNLRATTQMEEHHKLTKRKILKIKTMDDNWVSLANKMMKKNKLKKLKSNIISINMMKKWKMLTLMETMMICTTSENIKTNMKNQRIS